MLRTPEQYKESLRKMRPNIYKFDELISDVTTYLATRRCIEGHAQIFAEVLKPAHEATWVRGEEISTPGTGFLAEEVEYEPGGKLFRFADKVVENDCRS